MPLIGIDNNLVFITYSSDDNAECKILEWIKNISLVHKLDT